MRKLKRQLAHANMKRNGLTGVNKKNGGKSFFAMNWRKYVY